MDTTSKIPISSSSCTLNLHRVSTEPTVDSHPCSRKSCTRGAFSPHHYNVIRIHQAIESVITNYCRSRQSKAFPQGLNLYTLHSQQTLVSWNKKMVLTPSESSNRRMFHRSSDETVDSMHAHDPLFLEHWTPTRPGTEVQRARPRSLDTLRGGIDAQEIRNGPRKAPRRSGLIHAKRYDARVLAP